MKIKAIVFDLGGVLIVGSRAVFTEFYSKKLNVDKKKVKLALDKHMNEYLTGKVSENEFWNNFREIVATDASNPKLRKLFFSMSKPIKPVHKIVSSLKGKYKLGLITNMTNWLDEFDKKYNIIKNFDVAINSYDVGIKKPNPDIFNLMVSKLDVKPKEIIFIDDQKHNVRAAEKIGMKGILFKNPIKLKEELIRLGVNIN